MDADSSLDQYIFSRHWRRLGGGGLCERQRHRDGDHRREGCTAVQAVLCSKNSSVWLLLFRFRGAQQRCRARRSPGQWVNALSFRDLMYAYAQAFLEQVLVSVACNGAHSLKERLARWLLMMRDRGDDDALQINQKLLAEDAGTVQRPTITNAAQELERGGLIARGRSADHDTRSAGPGGGVL